MRQIKYKEFPAFSICIFGRYRVQCRGESHYNTPSFDYPNDWHTNKVRWQKTMNSADFISFIQRTFNGSDFCDMSIKPLSGTEAIIWVEYFDPITGECAEYRYKITGLPLKEQRRKRNGIKI